MDKSNARDLLIEAGGALIASEDEAEEADAETRVAALVCAAFSLDAFLAHPDALIDLLVESGALEQVGIDFVDDQGIHDLIPLDIVEKHLPFATPPGTEGFPLFRRGGT